MARPKPKTDRKITTMRLPDNLLKRVSAVGKNEGRSRANMTEIILLEGVKKREKSLGVLG